MLLYYHNGDILKLLETVHKKLTFINYYRGYTAWKQKKGSIVIAPHKKPEDILDLPPEKIKKLVQGIIWWDEHFSGLTLKDIAAREKCSEAYIGTAIFMSFDHLSKSLP